MTPNQVLQTYIALKLHFSTPSYDYVTYQGKLKKKIDFTKRNDKFQLEKIAKQYNPFGMLLSNLCENPNAWTSDIVSEKGFHIYQEWLKRQESLTYTFKEEIKNLDFDFNSNFKVFENQHPLAFRLYLGEKISIDTLCIINYLVNFYPHWNKELKDDLAWKSMSLRIPKYQRFVKIEKEKFAKILKDQFNAS